MPELSIEIADFCASHNFLNLDAPLKAHAEEILHFWAADVAENITAERVESSLKKIARLDLPLDVRKEAPRLLKEFIDFIVTTGRAPQAAHWPGYISQVESRYLAAFRDDGGVRGETFTKRYTDVGRNDPCPCGSGLKFKKCCMKLIS